MPTVKIYLYYKGEVNIHRGSFGSTDTDSDSLRVSSLAADSDFIQNISKDDINQSANSTAVKLCSPPLGGLADGTHFNSPVTHLRYHKGKDENYITVERVYTISLDEDEKGKEQPIRTITFGDLQKDLPGIISVSECDKQGCVLPRTLIIRQPTQILENESFYNGKCSSDINPNTNTNPYSLINVISSADLTTDGSNLISPDHDMPPPPDRPTVIFNNTSDGITSNFGSDHNNNSNKKDDNKFFKFPNINTGIRPSIRQREDFATVDVTNNDIVKNTHSNINPTVSRRRARDWNALEDEGLREGQSGERQQSDCEQSGGQTTLDSLSGKVNNGKSKGVCFNQQVLVTEYSLSRSSDHNSLNLMNNSIPTASNASSNIPLPTSLRRIITNNNNNNDNDLQRLKDTHIVCSTARQNSQHANDNDIDCDPYDGVKVDYYTMEVTLPAHRKAENMRFEDIAREAKMNFTKAESFPSYPNDLSLIPCPEYVELPSGELITNDKALATMRQTIDLYMYVQPRLEAEAHDILKRSVALLEPEYWANSDPDATHLICGK